MNEPLSNGCLSGVADGTFTLPNDAVRSIAAELLELRAKYQHAIKMHQQHSTSQLTTIKTQAEILTKYTAMAFRLGSDNDTAQQRISELTEEVRHLDAMVKDMQPCRLFHVALDVVEAERTAKDELLRWITALAWWSEMDENWYVRDVMLPLRGLLNAGGYTPEVLGKK